MTVVVLTPRASNANLKKNAWLIGNKNLISYEKQNGINDELNNCLKIAVVCTVNLYRRELQSKQGQNCTTHGPFQLCYTAVKSGPLKQETQDE
jgi:hypothetical protein